jgi:hypothetical protein
MMRVEVWLKVMGLLPATKRSGWISTKKKKKNTCNGKYQRKKALVTVIFDLYNSALTVSNLILL